MCRKNLLGLVGFILGMILVALTGCTSRMDSGRLVGFDFSVSLGEQTSLATTAGDETEAGAKLASHKPAVESANENGWQNTRGGFRTIGATANKGGVN